MDMSSYMPVKLVTGPGCVRAAAGELARLGKSCLIVTGKHSAKACGALEDVTQALREQGIRWTLYDGIGPNPQLLRCVEAGELAWQAGAEFVVGIGGGSPLDAAKCIAVLGANPGLTQEELYGFRWKNPPLKIVAVGTTAGTGSEVTRVSVITTPDGRKKSILHPLIYPTLALGDPRYTCSLPPEVTRSTLVDVLAHCAESYFNRMANHLSQSYALEGLRLLLPVMEAMASDPDREPDYATREILYCASLYGGLAINVTGTCFPHNMGYLLTETFGVPHGTACGVFQGDFYRYNKEVAPELAERFLKSLGRDEETYLALIEALTPQCRICLTREQIGEAYSRWIGNPSLEKCLGAFTPQRADALLREKFLREE